MILRSIYDEMIDTGKTLYVTFVDYGVAFDSISHRFLDQTLKDSGTSDKNHVLFRSVYNITSVVIKVPSTDGKEVLLEPFSIDHGVIQGDILSPLYFILTLELIL